MKLYIYEHCPFSARVRYVAGMLNIQLDVTWRVKKETDALNFDALLQDTPKIAKEVEVLIERAKSVLDLEACQRATLVDEAIVFSILRGFFSAAAIQWDPTVKHWMESVSHKAQVPLLK
ncbi:hypothetical protein [Vibrio coralliilyticus]|uniref:hypothetical protein n=1 Tax=Vibrio coralliilyticus TaxID=190893 RepID=UPI00148DF6BB|nr:hypothetical protein [Vibrio coralliilyticus]NOI51428.1 hypothetical protein [Vibrio coralliilyticus]